LEGGFALASLAVLDPSGCTRPDVKRALRASRPLSRGALALATADGEAHVVAVSVGDGRIRARIPTLEGPRSIERAPGAQALVAHTSQGAVTLLQGVPPRVRRVLRGFAQPRYTAVRADGRYAYVSDSGSGELVVIDLERGRVLRRVEVGALARHLALAPDERALWVALGSSARAITVVDVSEPDHPRVRRHVTPSFLAHDVGFAPGGRAVWVTASHERRIAVYATSAAHPPAVLSADEPPQHVSFRGAVAYVASGDSGSLQVRRARDGRVLHSARVAVGSYNVQTTGDVVLTPSLERGTLTILDAQGRVRHAPRVAPAAHDACVIG